MIKKILPLLVLLLIPSFSFAVNRVNDIGAYEDLGEGNLCTINSNLSFDCSESNNILVGQNTSNRNPSSTSYFWTTSGLAFYHYYHNNTSYNRQGYVDSFKFCSDSSCSNYNSAQSLTVDEFIDYVQNNELVSWEWYSTSSNRGIAGPMFYFSGGTILYSNPSTYTNYTPYNFNLLGWGLSGNYSSIDIINSPISNIPVIENVPIEVGTGNGLDGYVYIPISTGDYIDYYEKDRGFNSDICYIGTIDLTSNYGTGIQYYQGSGYTIFDFYSHLFNTSNISITEEGTFINTWIVNYDTFFLGLNRDADGNPWFVDFYNGPGNYGVNRGPGLTSPFTNNLIAYYFMASTIRDLVSDNGSIGEEVALYCYKKGLGGSYNINDNHNSVYDNWVGVYARNERNSGYFTNSGEEIVGQSWHGTPLDEMNWYNFTGAEDMDFKTFLSNSFNQFKVNYGTFDSSSVGLGALPTYIVMFLMALIFFRFISH